MTRLAREYARLRRQGFSAHIALDYARTAVEWDELELLSEWDDGTVRLFVEPDEYTTSIDDLIGNAPESVAKAETERANRDGVWGIVGQYLDPATRYDGRREWVTADSVWGFSGDDWQDSGYDYSVKRATLNAWARAYKPLARVLVAEGVGL